MPFSYIDVILVNLNLFKSSRAKTADLVRIYFTMRCRKWRIREARPQADQRLRVVKEDVGWLLSAGKSVLNNVWLIQLLLPNVTIPYIVGYYLSIFSAWVIKSH